MRLQESGEMYLETIWILSKTSNNVRSIDVADYMGYSKPSVSRAIGLLKDGGYVVSSGKGYLSLTDSGKVIAEKIYERHTMLSRFLILIGVDEKIATDDACRLEHYMSDETFDAIMHHAKQFEDGIQNKPK